MSSENKNFDEDFEDFDDVADNIEMDSDISGIDENTIDKALKNIVAQMPSKESSMFYEIQKQQDTEQEQNNSNDASIQDDDTDKASQDKSEEEIQENVSQPADENSAPEYTPQLQEALDSNEGKIPENESELSQWEELNDTNDVVKKYIIYVSKEFVPYIDKLSIDERSAYINDAIQQKIDSLDEQKQKKARKDVIIHFLIAVFAFLIMTPIGLYIANKAIMATFENYKYSQDNFEKLYKHRFEKDRAYIRSLQYNQEYEKKMKSSD